MKRVSGRPLLLASAACAAVLAACVTLLAGCAGVPSSSAPQAIGTVDRPAPPSLPKPTPDMDPDVLLRTFRGSEHDEAALSQMR